MKHSVKFVFMRKDQENIYRQIQDAINNLPDNFSILEEQIDVELQLQYFNFSKELKNEFSKEYILERKDDLLDENIPTEEKKNLLVLLASVNEVEAYRAVERFAKNPIPELKEWSILALQESRMLLQSTLLDEQQVFISTGLGGKGQKLRYYVVFINRKPDGMLNRTQQKLLKDELLTELKSNDGEFETIDFTEGFSTALVMLPLQTDLKNVFRNIIEECNQYGDFLNDDMILTNVKMLSRNEITEMLQSGQVSDFEDPEEWNEMDDDDDED